eukprot:3933388-Rhodomonas_salina.2
MSQLKSTSAVPWVSTDSVTYCCDEVRNETTGVPYSVSMLSTSSTRSFQPPPPGGSKTLASVNVSSELPNVNAMSPVSSTPIQTRRAPVVTRGTVPLAFRPRFGCVSLDLRVHRRRLAARAVGVRVGGARDLPLELAAAATGKRAALFTQIVALVVALQTLEGTGVGRGSLARVPGLVAVVDHVRDRGALRAEAVHCLRTGDAVVARLTVVHITLLARLRFRVPPEPCIAHPGAILPGNEDGVLRCVCTRLTLTRRIVPVYGTVDVPLPGGTRRGLLGAADTRLAFTPEPRGAVPLAGAVLLPELHPLHRETDA